MSEVNPAIMEALKDTAGGVVQGSDEQKSAIADKALELLTAKAQVSSLEQQLKDAQELVKRISEIELPNLMIEAQMKGFELLDGSKLEVKRFYGAGVKVDERPVAFKWLVDHEHDALIKTEVNVTLGKGQTEAAEWLAAAIDKALSKASDEDLRQIRAQVEQSIHWQTLRAFVREQIEAEEAALARGETVEDPLPRELFGVFVGNVAEITPPKKPKKK